MNAENEKYLLEKYPGLYRQHKLSMQETCMVWGFECGDGWLKIIDDLSQKIMDIDPTVEAVQVKSKFGGLRFYTGPVLIETSDQVYDAINEAEELAYKTCEHCGTMENVSQNDGGWIYTLCTTCRDKMKATRAAYQKEYEDKKKKEVQV